MNTTTLDVRANRRIGSVVCRKWRLETLLGGGETAFVYGATVCGRRRQRLAVRLLHSELSTDEHIRACFFREGRASDRVHHPAAVPVAHHGVAEDGSAFLVTELLDGETLEQSIVRSQFPLTSALLLADQLLDVLACAHQQKVFHRNLCPHHLILSPGGALRVLDFGGARLREVIRGSGRPGSFLGYPGYAPPEQVCGRSEPQDPRCDIYAVGALVYRLLSGRLVHEAPTCAERMARTISSPPQSVGVFATDLPNSVVDLVDRALRYEPGERWPDARSMQRQLRRSIEDLSGSNGSFSGVAVPRRRTLSLAPWLAPATEEPALSSDEPRRSRLASWVGIGLAATTGLTWALVGPQPRRDSLGAAAAAAHLASAHDTLPDPRGNAPLCGGGPAPGLSHGTTKLVCDVRSMTAAAEKLQPGARKPQLKASPRGATER